MFDIGFFELVMVAVVALLVLGPERLPHAVRMTGAFVGKIRRTVATVRDEFEREVQMAEMQQRIKEQLEKAGLDDARKALEDTKKSVEDTRHALQQNVIAPPTPAASGPVAAQDDADTRHSAPSPENAAPAPPPEPVSPPEPDKPSRP